MIITGKEQMKTDKDDWHLKRCAQSEERAKPNTYSATVSHQKTSYMFVKFAP
jgi:hypothetical protein